METAGHFLEILRQRSALAGERLEIAAAAKHRPVAGDDDGAHRRVLVAL
jgi:hypothetical protein